VCSCQTTGSCQTSRDQRCVCNPNNGYAGPYCSARQPPAYSSCNVSPCINGGVCTNLINDYYCTCPTGYYGKNCESYTQKCANNPCMNGGVCNMAATNNNYQLFSANWHEVCTCKNGWTGYHCQIVEGTQCSSNPCQNGGTCLGDQSLPTATNSYYCECAPLWTGLNCQLSRVVPSCASNPCMNGGVCTDTFSPVGQAAGLSTYFCACPEGFAGQRCESQSALTAIYDFCGNSPCQNGGVCRDNFAQDVTCLCPGAYTGQWCQNFDPLAGAAGLTPTVMVLAAILAALVANA